ncbi:RNA polymerase II subunit A C-terminal domain phosphatase SSU72 [Trichinella nelsoni]|uniref:RNA polymerase II subunit A C-terminal domain phosphatase SSU72 n=1 Tax=Trichinella nelsoni TaxID=6336 RepID=A0A0V0SMB7_9BILA|nr:RNA polymerase II subunit A C-terminal domain phosphatase SSU72 [Trichinella nelsoni]
MRKKGFNVRSFGSGSQVKLPGPSPTVHNIYSFSTPYEEIYQDLVAKDKNLYTQNGLLNMLDRNRRVKPHPERFQEYKGLSDVIICCEELLMNTEMKHCHLVHIINIDIRDNHEEATCGALLFCHLCTLLEKSADLDNEIEEILSNFENICKRTILHTRRKTAILFALLDFETNLFATFISLLQHVDVGLALKCSSVTSVKFIQTRERMNECWEISFRNNVVKDNNNVFILLPLPNKNMKQSV